MELKIAIAQLNPTVGAIEDNAALIFAAYEEAAKAGADLVVAPEAALTGYPLEDLVLRDSIMDFAAVQAIDLIAKVQASGFSAGLIFGSPVARDNDERTNSAFLIDPCAEEINRVKIVDKVELPNYGVFDEKRVFKAGGRPSAWEFRGHKIGVMICEDAWFPRVSRELWLDGAVMLIAINGSPYAEGKNVTRRKVVAKRIQETGLPFLYVNLVGGQDELIFDGSSFLYDGEKLVEAPFLQTGLTYVTTTLTDEPRDRYQRVTDWGEVVGWNTVPPKLVDLRNYPRVEPTGIADSYRIIVQGTRDYLRKTGFKSGTLGISGGIDSALVSTMGTDALGGENMHLVSMPSKFSTGDTLSDAEILAKNLGANYRVIPIEDAVQSIRSVYQTKGTADENTQSRMRGIILGAISNQEGHLILNTGNKSENSVGYFTTASANDANGGWNLLKDCWKSLHVYPMAEWRNSLTEDQLREYGFLGPVAPIPEAIITKVPTAGLSEGQKDTDSLPPYEIMDPILVELVEHDRGIEETSHKLGAQPSIVQDLRKKLIRAEFKRRQTSPGPKITGMLHGRERRYPIANAWLG